MNATIARCLRQVRPAPPQGIRLRVVPIIGLSHDQPPYRLLEPPVAANVRVTEINEGGSVPELKVTNNLDVRLLLIDGQELVGAKQNRILNTDVLVPAQTTLKIPVSCVERGRWHHTGAAFVAGKSASHRTRSAKQQRVHESLRREGRHDADQQAVWREVDESLSAAACPSPTRALSDVYAQREDELTGFRQGLTLPPEAVGMAAFHGSRLQGIDLFDRPSTLRYFWDSLIDSYAIDWLSVPVDPAEPAATPDERAVGQALEHAAAGQWEAFASPGEGQDWRLEDSQWAGSALVWANEAVIHVQMFPRQPAAGSRRTRIYRRNGTAE